MLPPPTFPYFDNANDSFTYSKTLTFSDIQTGTNSYFVGTSSPTNTTGYNLQAKNNTDVNITITDGNSFMVDSKNTSKAAVIATDIKPSSSNPSRV